MTTRTNGRAKTAATVLAATVLGVGIAAAAIASERGDDAIKGGADRLAKRAADSRPTLPMEEVIARLRAAGYTEVREIEHERGRYEVKARDEKGRRVEVYVDARTGDLLEGEKDD